MSMNDHHIDFPALRNRHYPVHAVAETLEPYLRAIVEQFHPDKVILFGSYAYGEPTAHSDFDLLVVRRDIHSAKASNMEIRRAIWNVRAAPASFTFLSRTPEQVEEKLKNGSPIFHDIVHKGITLYAAETTSETDPSDWFAFAAERMRGADVLWREEGVTGLGIEALQEAVERFLKGFLIARGWTLVKTHDLERLVHEAAQFDSSFNHFVPLAIELTEDFFSQHYPGDDTTDTGKNYEALRKQAGEIVALIQSLLPKYFL